MPPPSSRSITPALASEPAMESDREVAEAIAVRTKYGLQADVAWIRQVAADPASTVPEEYGIPMMPDEYAGLISRPGRVELLAMAQAYCGSFAADCAGAYINLQAPGVVVDVARNVDRHRMALASLDDPSLIEVREVRWSLADLEGFQELVESERDWFASVGLTYLQAGRRIYENHVYVDYRGRSKASEQVVMAHFGIPTWLRPEWHPFPWDGPRAALIIKVRDGRGERVPWIQCILEPQNDVVVPEMNDALFMTNETGACEVPNAPTVAYKVLIHRWNDGTFDPEPVEDLVVVVPPEGTTVTVVVP